jgi:hypothetical protein
MRLKTGTLVARLLLSATALMLFGLDDVEAQSGEVTT